MRENEPRDRYDVVIVGGGPAGMSAAIYTVRQGLTTAIMAGELGGQALWASRVENYLGFADISGDELVSRFRSHVGSFDIALFEGQYANAIVPGEGCFDVYSREGLQLSARAIVIASGRAPVRLTVPGETELIGRGVSYCATCDAAFFRGRPTAVVGPGDSAAQAALQLAALDASVVLISEQELRVSPGMLSRLAGDTHVVLRAGSHVTRIVGDDQVSGIVVRDSTGDETLLAVDAVFIESGSIPAAEFTAGLVQVSASGEIEVDHDLMTSRPGVFAAGTITDSLGKQIIISAGDGARAGVAAARWLQQQ